jgi:hypothetical protein
VDQLVGVRCVLLDGSCMSGSMSMAVGEGGSDLARDTTQVP